MENGHDDRPHLTDFVVRFWLLRHTADPPEMEPCSLPSGTSHEASDKSLVFSEPCLFHSVKREGWARSDYPAFRVLNLRFTTTTLPKEELVFWVEWPLGIGHGRYRPKAEPPLE